MDRLRRTGSRLLFIRGRRADRYSLTAMAFAETALSVILADKDAAPHEDRPKVSRAAGHNATALILRRDCIVRRARSAILHLL